MYSTRMILILLLVAVILLCVSLFLLLVWMPGSDEDLTRETSQEESVTEVTSEPPTVAETSTEESVSQTNELEIAPLGSDHGMEFPTIDEEFSPTPE